MPERLPICPVMSRPVGVQDEDGAPDFLNVELECIGARCAAWISRFDDNRKPYGNCAMMPGRVDPLPILPVRGWQPEGEPHAEVSDSSRCPALTEGECEYEPLKPGDSVFTKCKHCGAVVPF